LSLKTHFVNVVLPVPIPSLFTYRVQREWLDNLAHGKRVLVPFGKSKLYTGIVWKIHEQNPGQYQVKYIHSILDDAPTISKKTAEFWTWVANYYSCTLGEVMQAALPSLLKLQSEQILILVEPSDGEIPNKLSENEQIVYEILLQKNQVSVKELFPIMGNALHKTVYSLYNKGMVITKDEIVDLYKEKTKKIIQKNPKLIEQDWEEIFDSLEKKAPKQADTLLRFFQGGQNKIDKSEFVKNNKSSVASLQKLIKKGFILEHTITQSRLTNYQIEKDQNQLSSAQNLAYHEIKKCFESKKPALLWGVTASGKTHVYIELIKDQIGRGNQVLFLLPEIALTTHLTQRLSKYFGHLLTVTHSKYNQKERVESWNKIANGEKKVVVGVRSSIFSNFHKLGLIIVDEEHENSFKQFDPNPRYHARDAAVYLASKYKANILLGSATPSVETFQNVRVGKYGLIRLENKFIEGKKPKIICIDLKEEKKKKRMYGPFSQTLIDAIDQCIDNKQKVLLFQNRKGFVPMVECETCGHIAQCISCDVSLVYYKKNNQLRCHYCGYKEQASQKCTACKSTDLTEIGYGTEKIEEIASEIFSNYKISRLDQNAASTKKKYENILQKFDEGTIDILIGTQMISKGLDFENVGLVGIVDGDALLHFPDFRAHERTYQLITQVAGRAGRKGESSQVFIQTYKPHHPIYKLIIEENYEAFFEREKEERLKHHYPPHKRLIKITVRNSDFLKCKHSADALCMELKKISTNVLGPSPPVVARVRNKFLLDLLIKVEVSSSFLQQIKEKLKICIQTIKADKAYKTSDFVVNVDPY